MIIGNLNLISVIHLKGSGSMIQNHGGLLERFISCASSVIWQWTTGWMAMALFLAGIKIVFPTASRLPVGPVEASCSFWVMEQSRHAPKC
jgi:hypothetical protein